jgi:ribose/xylose/arabinose/galactoside ABC-type transport system permease subunit
VGIVGLGMTFVILTAGIDLSVGSIVAVSSVISAKMLADGQPVSLVMAAGIGVGLLCVLTNGVVIANLQIPPFIMTLGMFAIARGVALTLADGRPISIGGGADDIKWLGRGDWLGLPVPVWLLLGLALLAAFVLRFTAYGRAVYALGSSREAARLAGINTKLVESSVYAISGAMAGLTALILMSRLTIGSPAEGTGLELNAIAITVIGGTSLFGGEGGVGGTLIGASIIAVLANLLNLLGVSPFTQEILEGIILVAAVMLGVLQRRRRA